MNKQINAAIVIHRLKESTVLKTELEKNNIVLTTFNSLNGLKNTGFYDVIMLHESFVKEVDNELFQDSQLLILTESKNISDVFLQVKDLQVYTVLSWPCDVKELKNYINQAYNHLIKNKTDKASKATKGKTIAITSFANGSGKSLIAYNLASKLATFLQSDSVCLVDMNLPFSAARALLNIQDNYNWHSIRPILKEGEPSKQKIQNIMYTTKYNFSLLSGPTDFETNTQLSLKEITNLQKGLKEIYQATVVDYHTVLTKEDFEYIRNTDVTLAIIDLKSLSILQSIRTIHYIRENEPEIINKMRFIFNGIDSANGKTAELVQAKLGIEPFAVIDRDNEAVEKIIENGELFADKSLLIDSQIYNLAEKVIKELF